MVLSPAERGLVDAVTEAGLQMATMLELLRGDLADWDDTRHCPDRVDEVMKAWAKANYELDKHRKVQEPHTLLAQLTDYAYRRIADGSDRPQAEDVALQVGTTLGWTPAELDGQADVLDALGEVASLLLDDAQEAADDWWLLERRLARAEETGEADAPHLERMLAGDAWTTTDEEEAEDEARAMAGVIVVPSAESEDVAVARLEGMLGPEDVSTLTFGVAALSVTRYEQMLGRGKRGGDFVCPYCDVPAGTPT